MRSRHRFYKGSSHEIYMGPRHRIYTVPDMGFKHKIPTWDIHRILNKGSFGINPVSSANQCQQLPPSLLPLREGCACMDQELLRTAVYIINTPDSSPTAHRTSRRFLNLPSAELIRKYGSISWKQKPCDRSAVRKVGWQP